MRHWRHLLSPEAIAKRSATQRAANERKRAAHRAERKTCVRWGATFQPSPTKVDVKAWEKRQFCGRACSARGIMERPEVQAKHQTAMRTRFDDPEYRARHAASAAINARKAAAHSNHKKSGETRTRRAIGWIPEEFRKTYVRMRENFGAAEAKRMIREHMAFAARRDIARITADMEARHRRDIERRRA